MAGNTVLPAMLVSQFAASLSCVLVSKSLASWRSWSCSEGSPCKRLTIRPRFTAGRADIVGRCQSSIDDTEPWLMETVKNRKSKGFRIRVDHHIEIDVTLRLAA